jgi:hypothetical protein
MGEEQEPGSVKIELTSEEDIFFHYICDINDAVFV